MQAVGIIGCAPNWKVDLDILKGLTDSLIVIAVGLDCPYDGIVDYFATYHTIDIEPYRRKREAKGLNTDYKVISHVKEKNKSIDLIYPYEKPSGSSSLLAAIAAVNQGYKKIVLCGCPLEGVNDQGVSYKGFQQGWIKHVKKLNGCVRSMSGWTKEFLGEPTKEFLGEPTKEWLEDLS